MVGVRVSVGVDVGLDGGHLHYQPPRGRSGSPDRSRRGRKSRSSSGESFHTHAYTERRRLVESFPPRPLPPARLLCSLSSLPRLDQYFPSPAASSSLYPTKTPPSPECFTLLSCLPLSATYTTTSLCLSSSPASPLGSVSLSSVAGDKQQGRNFSGALARRQWVEEMRWLSFSAG